MKKALFLSLFLLTTYLVQSQDAVLSEYYSFDPKLVNPAFAGLMDGHSIVFAPNLYTGSDDGMPVQGILSYDTRLSKYNSGVGVIASYEKVGVHKNRKYSLLYNYQIRTSERGRISLGAAVSYSYLVSDYGLLVAGAPLAGKLSATEFNYDLGVSYHIDKAIIGFSVQNLAESVSTSPDVGFARASRKNTNLFVQREFGLGSWLRLTPAILYSRQQGDNMFDLNAFANIGKWVILGAQLGTNERRSIFGGLTFKDAFQVCLRLHTRPDRFNTFYSGDRFSFMLKASITKSTSASSFNN